MNDTDTTPQHALDAMCRLARVKIQSSNPGRLYEYPEFIHDIDDLCSVIIGFYYNNQREAGYYAVELSYDPVMKPYRFIVPMNKGIDYTNSTMRLSLKRRLYQIYDGSCTVKLYPDSLAVANWEDLL